MNKGIGIVLIVLAVVLAYMGINAVSDSGGSVEVIGIELSAEDSGMKTQGFIYLALSVVSFIGGLSILRKK
ncbi:MAG: hypothetical protein ACI9P5_003783 [Saprospiraceae bacterium]|jgi:hypothetical protein|tara:strand:- start:541 stop:753 length:213 start_codon:yes stop_codon:yes gene_type:complete